MPMETKKAHRGRERKVHFATFDKVAEIPHIRDFTKEHIRDVYMSNEELVAVRTECKTLVRMMDEGMHVGEDGKELFCTRGLHSHTKAQTSMVREIQNHIYDAVYTAQCFQDSKGNAVAPLIATLCQRISTVSAQQAYAMGKLDARAARHVNRAHRSKVKSHHERASEKKRDKSSERKRNRSSSKKSKDGLSTSRHRKSHRNSSEKKKLPSVPSPSQTEQRLPLHIVVGENPPARSTAHLHVDRGRYPPSMEIFGRAPKALEA